ncbi:MAG: EAL domain-containing protein [Pseudomonadota bacterium]
MHETSQVNAVGNPIRSLVSLLRISDVIDHGLPEAAAKRYRRRQIRGIIDQMRIMLLGNTIFAPALSFQAWNAGINELVIAWTAVMLIFSWWLFLSWMKIYETDGAASDLTRFIRQTFVNSSLWFLGMALFYPVVEGDQKALVATIMAGSLAIGTVGFSRSPEVGLTYLWVQVVGNTTVAFTCGVRMGSSEDILLAFLLLIAGASLFNAVLERGRSSLAAFKAHEQLSEKSEVIELLLKDYEEQATEWLWQTDASGRILSAPSQILKLLDASATDLDDLDLTEIVSQKSSPDSSEDVSRLKKAFGQPTEFYDVKFDVFDKDRGGLRWILIKGRPQFETGEFKGFRGIFADATAEVNAERRVQFLASFDSLTELYNRNTVQRNLSELEAGDTAHTAFLIDLDGFKQVNDSYGHTIGDALLAAVANRLRTFQGRDTWVARLGGDEFFVLNSAVGPDDDIAWLGDQIIETLSRPFQVGNFEIQLSASIGVARFPSDTQIGLDLLSLTDLALYEAKSKGRNRIERFDLGMQQRFGQRNLLIERLKHAVGRGDIVPHYQSQHRLWDGQLIGFEALARWHHEELGWVAPDTFIPLAEQTGLIVDLGEQLMRQACRDACQWASSSDQDAVAVSVNISPIQFARTDVPGQIAAILTETGLAPHLLEIEITESVLISDRAQITDALRCISGMGVSIALDDFGAGYSSLGYLRELPLDRLKIDRSFMIGPKDLSTDPVLQMIIQLGHTLGMSVTAEGVEKEQQVEMLRHIGCDIGQGYFYSHPVPMTDLQRQSCAVTASPSARR